MRSLPLADPGTPDTRSATRFLLWHVRLQWRTLLVGLGLSSSWLASGALGPIVLGTAIDRGVIAHDTGALVRWSGVLLLLGVVSSVGGTLGHRNAVQRWLTAAYTTIQLVARQATRLGGQLPARIPTGEVVSVGASDVDQIGGFMDQLSLVFASVVSFVVVAVILLDVSVPLGLIVVIGAPVLVALVTPLLKPLHVRQGRQRAAIGELSTQGSDIVSGLRVLRGIGGEDTFAGNYAATSQLVRRHGVAVGGFQAVIDASQVFVSGIFVVILTWLGARAVVAGTMTVGDLVAFYGYAAFLMGPLRNAFNFADRLTRAHVAAGRAVRVLSLEPEIDEPAQPRHVPSAQVLRTPGRGDLVDGQSGTTAAGGRFTAVVADVPEDAAALADRLGRYREPDHGADTLAGTDLRDLTLADVRATILVNDTDAAMFAGTLRTELDPHAAHDDTEILQALHVASGEDILDGLPAGLDSVIEEKGRGFSGGQRQRLVLTRALLADPEVLVLVEPTSAVDAHTEARIAERLHTARAGRTTVVTTTSPLVLTRADQVVLLVAGEAVVTGRHHDLVTGDRRYRTVVTRDTEPEEVNA